MFNVVIVSLLNFMDKIIAVCALRVGSSVDFDVEIENTFEMAEHCQFPLARADAIILSPHIVEQDKKLWLRGYNSHHNKMLRKFGVCMAMLVAVHSNDALARQLGNSFTPPARDDPEDSYSSMTKGQSPTIAAGDLDPSTSPPILAGITPTRSAPPIDGTPTLKVMTIPNARTDTPVGKTLETDEGTHSRDCNPNFPHENTKDSETSAAAALKPVPKEMDKLSPSPEGPVEAPVAVDEQLDSTKSTEPTTQQVNTQSMDENSGTSTSSIGFVLVGAIAAVAAVGVFVAHMKKARDTDAALITPDDEAIHIEIRRTPAGGSTIL
ncbi:hypothetical protein PsorP6_006942 [Peronosclerospora sorghi]|uniref:Uncharacterized protein n=1 Tax=Peronosclerospora sorghi TaxID=230839 RepID=A0ACC0WCY7_9STRA|nr:hypothetical protein PsorP6_006942 [Peronosclerospora sorghi]